MGLQKVSKTTPYKLTKAPRQSLQALLDNLRYRVIVDEQSRQKRVDPLLIQAMHPKLD